MTIRWILSCVIAIQCFQATAQETDKPAFYAVGIGDMSCGKYIASFDDAAPPTAYRWWIAGFLTGHNAARGSTKPIDMDAALAWLTAYCEANAFEKFLAAAVKLQNTVNAGP